MLKKGDILLIVFLLLCSFIPEGIFLLSGADTAMDKTYAVIYVDGEMYKTLPLSEHTGTDTFTIRTERGFNTVVVKENTIGIVEADCPDGVCISEGFISKPGATSVCLPHKVLIEVRASDNSDADVIRAR
ncbi:NusG domain II-containing protein [Megasphaera vaginalis (ex Srinivasan et al. 2021)]|uniref:PF07009 family protein n=1 Tax=Megasphaera vaginalis (ex Srinivasan et al. 2021) TaxID=1111454 RepID=U7URC8_9FIRM|nr:NusG domain II-containing protein [Megasphaera vaginalis (ex Srinivasan et al. 2021)]ERT61013.1 PF07009 family protein [Megasphaera vaginalis (ex Srinivasan et al. 2021)]